MAIIEQRLRRQMQCATNSSPQDYKGKLLRELDEALDHWVVKRQDKEAMTAGHAAVKEGAKPNLNDVCRLLQQSWTDVSTELINCWLKVTCLPASSSLSSRAVPAKGKRNAICSRQLWMAFPLSRR